MTTQKQRSFQRPLTWAFVCGVVAFVFGAFAQDWLLADATPMSFLVGFITAPTAFMIGIVLGVLSELSGLKASTDRMLLLFAIPIMAVATLLLVIFRYTEFSPEAYLVEAEITGCEKPQDVIEEKNGYWRDQIAENRRRGGRNPRPDWQQDVPRMLRETPGLVLSLHVVQESAVRIHRWRWGDVWLKADPWTTVDQTKKVFAHGDAGLGTSCDQIAQGKAGFWALNWEQSEGFPPEALPEFLSLYVIKPVPAEYERFLPATR